MIRTIGNNIKWQLKEKNITIKEFADKLGYSVFDVQKLCDGRLFITNEELYDICDYFKISMEELLIIKKYRYVGEEFLQCVGEFNSKENEEKILDIFDMYCDLEESIERNEGGIK